MNWGKMRFACCGLVLVGVSALPIHVAQAGDAPRLSGSYQVVHRADTGDQTSVRLQIHLVNRGPSELHVQRITLWNLSHPGRGATQSCSIVIHRAGSADTTQEFTVPRAEYELLKRGARPRLVLEVAAPGRHTTTEVVRLDSIVSGKGN
jgi:hypothetical protein